MVISPISDRRVMPKFRVQAEHYMREYITIDVEAESREEVENRRNDIYGMACELPDWHLDGDTGPAEDNLRFLDEEDGPDAYYDSPPDASLSIGPEGKIEVVDPGGPANKDKVRAVLEKHSSKCLDNEEERELILNEILGAIA